MPIPDQKLPDLKEKLNNPPAETEIFLCFKRVYEYIDAKIRSELIALENKVRSGEAAPKDYNNLVNFLTTPLIGEGSDPLLQSLAQSYGEQAANSVLAAPSGSAGVPSFRQLIDNDIPNLDASKITSGIFDLSFLDVRSLKTDDGLAEDVTGAPNANTGFIILKDNDGNQIKVMTCA